MKQTTITIRIFFTVVALFIIYTALFIAYQQHREKQYRIELVEANQHDRNPDVTEESLPADHTYIWFSAVVFVVLCIVLLRFTSRLSKNINNLRIFAYRAGHNESLETKELAEFPDDELGEIAERIIKIYKQLQKSKEAQNRLKRELTQNIAHELKTPIASIHGYLETILSHPTMSDGQRTQFLQRSYAQTERLSALVQDIALLNRMDDSQALTEFEITDITQIVRNIVDETAMQLSSQEMTFDNQLPEKIVLNANPNLIYSIFRNLTDNAIAYAGKGTAITLTAHETERHWSFTFSDNGVGIAEEHLPRIFERFYRTDKGRSRSNGGTGLGLAIVKNAVLTHRGAIVASNAVGGGLIITFTLRK